MTKDEFDYDKIRFLKDELSGYVTINNIRGTWSSASGAKEWLGWIELTRNKRSDQAINNTARVFSDVDADIFCPVEVENRILLQTFHDEILKKEYLEPNNKDSYDYILLIDGNDTRGIDVAVMSRFPISWVKSHIHETMDYFGKETKIFSRDCLEASIQLPNDEQLIVLVNHLKSRGYSHPLDFLSRKKRKAQAERVSEILDEHNLKQEYVAVVGDLNDGPTSESLAPLIDKEGLYNVNLELDENQRGTYRTGKEQIDYVLISDALKEQLDNVYIERRGVYCKKKWVPYETVLGKLTEASDHAVVVADFNL